MYGSGSVSAKFPLLVIALITAVGCQVYDESLLQRSYGQSAQAGSSAGRGSAGAAGSSEDDPTAQARCGDGRIEPSEKCDTGILEGMPGACPFLCSAPACRAALITGTGCQTECETIELDCQAGDGCCPATCSASNDPDCSGMCGDGIVQSDLAETCEARASACPSTADCDDDDPCTLDAISGSATNCNAQCTHSPVTVVQNDDGCCPMGADANVDADCSPRCGNGVREGEEACDGSTGCDDSCNLTLSSTQALCLDALAMTDCERCQCLRCTEAVLACSSSGDASRDQACSAITHCAVEEDCAGDACYCGTAPYGLCPIQANGPCKMVIESAVGTTSFSRIEMLGDEPDSVLGRAVSLGTCRRAQCATECRKAASDVRQ